MTTWRLILDPPQLGAANMAADEAIFNAVRAAAQPPTLRLYRWTTPCLSLGYGQRIRDVDAEALAAHEWGWVRRPTGGRAVLHADELTYSVAFPAGHPMGEGGVLASYQRISRALLAGLAALGIDASAAISTSAPSSATPICFETPSHYEIAVGGRKLVGSAQFRRDGALIQHGSLPLWGDLGRIAAVLRYSDVGQRAAAAAAVRAGAITLAEAFNGEEIGWERAADAIVYGFEQTFVLKLELGSLSATEQAECVRLTQEKYTAHEWIYKR